ncbi:MAG: glycosyltransferase [Bacteroidales bacterium]|nr:glycosyltransferase [Bacteroidales bacterium]
MKILQLGKFYPIRGGVEKVMWDLTVGLAERGIHCDMLCAVLPGEQVDVEHQFMVVKDTKETLELSMGPYGRVIGVRAIAKKAATMLSPAMIRWLRRHAAEYDIIHIHHPDPMAALALWCSGYKGRVLLHWHSDIIRQKFLLFFYTPLQSWLIRRAERIIGTTPVYIRESPHLRHVQDKVTYVPIGIQPVIYDPREADRIRDDYPGKKIVFALGRLVPYKGFDTLISAAARLSSDYIVLIGGKGPLQEELERQIAELGAQDRVKLLGFVPTDQVASLFGACDIFAMSSNQKTEAFGIVQIEAMSCGKPVVTTRIPHSGVSWVNQDGVSGLVVPPSDPKNLAFAIKRICDNETNYQRFSAGAMERYEDIFTSRQMIDKIINVYEQKD